MSLDRHLAAKIREMLAQRLPIQAIRRETGVSRKTIRRLARQPAPPDDQDGTEEDLLPLRRVPVYRCKCGHLVVYRPCRICLTRRASLTSADVAHGPGA